MTIRIPKWVLGVVAVLVVAGLAAGGYFLGRSSSSNSHPTAPSPASTASSTGPTIPQFLCTKGSAEQAVLNSDLPGFIKAAGGIVPHPFIHRGTGYFVTFLRCADLTRDGRNEMVVGLGAGTGGTFDWAIFMPAGHRWSLAFDQEGPQIEDLKVEGGNVLEVQAIYGPTDVGCCPSGKRVSKVAWDGQAFRVSTVHVKKPLEDPD